MAVTLDDESPAFVNTALQLLQEWLPARCAALLRVDDERLALVASHGLDQRGLDNVAALWARSRPDLTQAIPYRRRVRDREVLVLPCPVEGAAAGWLVYLELLDDVPVRPPRQLRGLVDVLCGGSDASVADARTPSDADAANLAILLESHEWNVSRVARALKVTRMTVYNRMRRAGIPRRRVSKTRQRTRPPAAGRSGV